MSTQKIISLLEKLKSDHILKCLGGCFPDNRTEVEKVNSDIYETIDVLHEYEEKCLMVDENMIRKMRQQITDISNAYFALYEILIKIRINVKARDMMTKFYEENEYIYQEFIKETDKLKEILNDSDSDDEDPYQDEDYEDEHYD
jgi:hypothetical protein